jgi:hypothetical protein
VKKLLAPFIVLLISISAAVHADPTCPVESAKAIQSIRDQISAIIDDVCTFPWNKASLKTNCKLNEVQGYDCVIRFSAVDGTQFKVSNGSSDNVLIIDPFYPVRLADNEGNLGPVNCISGGAPFTSTYTEVITNIKTGVGVASFSLPSGDYEMSYKP